MPRVLGIWYTVRHAFFFFVGELTITLEDVVNNFLLPMFGDESPFDIQLFAEDLPGIVDTIFCPPSICMLDPEKSKNIIFS